ncbi:hypothetical protein L5I01_30185 [Gordonia sp. HY442]|uniref:hypothetical protein n=1 Tax=Gordonia zhenghanii TaxID=2911516 RepID=UPI001F316726|nr:hypothetical protein [Gordonia zhenghanii]MCF8607633.1 hypothetical protein [Gordonia zhenghanii]
MTTPPRPDQPDSNNQPDPTNQPGQTNQPGNPFSQQGNAQGPVYGQQQQSGHQPPPVYGQQQAYGQHPGQHGYQPQAGYGPPPGGPGNPPPPPSGIRSNKVIPIVIGCIAVAILVAVVAGYLAFRDTEGDGTDVDASPVGSCLTVDSKELSKVETKRIDCDDTDQLTFIVAAKKPSAKACEKAALRFWVTEYGDGASEDTLCLAPNYVQGHCYEESSVATGPGIKTVPCSQESSMMSVVYKVTERVKSTSVPNCTDRKKQKVYVSKIDTGPNDALGVCAQIQGNYTWEEE